MLLTSISINDFGVYGNENHFDLRTTPERPIVLFGGRNGAGKTTLFESVMLCLYGQDYFDNKLSKKQYKEKILRSFHRDLGSKKTAEEASIIVEFEYAHQGKTLQYLVQRLWKNNNGDVDEEFTIKKREPESELYEELDSLEKSEWQMFIHQLIPKGIAKLFFFDGEKIQTIAEEGTEDVYIKSSFDTLLGLDVVNQLSLDLGYALDRMHDESKTKEIEQKISEAEKKKQALERKLKNNLIRQTKLKTDILNKQKQILVKEENFARLGGKYYEKREELLNSKTFHETTIKNIEKELRDLCAATLPFALIPQQLDELSEELRADQQKIQEAFAKDILEESFDQILDTIRDKDFMPKVDDNTKSKFEEKLNILFDERLSTLSEYGSTSFNLSLSDMSKIIEFIKKTKAETPEKIQKLIELYNEEIDVFNRLKVELENVPKDKEIGPLRSKINQLNREVGQLEEQLTDLKTLESNYRHYMNKENKAIRNSLTKKFSDNRVMNGLNLGPKIQTVLEEYADLLRSKKLALLEDYILDGIKLLLHKKEFIDTVKINPETFEVSLFKGDDEIRKDMLSKGELQMFATSVLWGLAKTSGRPLPFMIDTPLARLDDEHRINLIEDFFPAASHQILIFSTNSEINEELYTKLKPSIAKSFIIEFDSSKGKTTSQNGYFFERGEVIEVQ